MNGLSDEGVGVKEGTREFLLEGDDRALWVRGSARKRPRGGCGGRRGGCWPF